MKNNGKIGWVRGVRGVRVSGGVCGMVAAGVISRLRACDENSSLGICFSWGHDRCGLK